MPHTHTVIIADRSELFASGVGQLLAERGYRIAGVVTRPRELLALAAEHQEAILLVDEMLGEGVNGGFIKRLVETYPDQAVVVLNATGRTDDIIQALASGAVGVINKNAAGDHIFAAIDVVAGGGLVLCSETVRALRDQLSEVFELMNVRIARRLALTKREMEVLDLLPSALTLGQIAGELFVSRKTVQNNSSSLYRKLGVTSRSEAVAQAISLGLLPPRSIAQFG